MEAGHRCAIPTCKNTPIEIAPIDPWSKVKEHAFENLIALCPTCHAQYDRGDIDRQSILGYKSNLATLNGRYGSYERRALQFFADGGEPGSGWPTEEERAKDLEPGSMWLTPHILRTIGDRDIDLYFLLRDGMLQKRSLPR